MPSYTITVATTFSQLAPLREFWEANQRRANADYEFFQLIVESRPNIISPCVFVVKDDDATIALLVGRLERKQMTYRLGYLSVAKLLTRQLVLIDGGYMGECSEAIWEGLHRYIDLYLRREKIDIAHFAQVRISSAEHIIGKKALSRIRFCQADAASKHWLLRLPQSMDDFLKARSRKHRYWIKRLFNVLDKEFGQKWEIRRYKTIDDAKDFGLHAEEVAKTTYHRSLGSGFILKEETIKRLRLEASRDQFRGYILFIDNEPKAFWYCSLYQQTLSLCSTGYLDAFRRYELGTVLLVKVFEDHCGLNNLVVDFGLGDAAYKQRFASEHYMEAPLLLFSRSARGLVLRTAHAIFQGSARAIKSVAESLGVDQKIKTFARRIMGKKQQAAEAPSVSGGADKEE